MLHKFEEYGFFAEITGFRNVKFEQAEAYLKANRKTEQKFWIQLFNADLIATEEHLYFAVLNALSAFRSRTNLSKSLAMETMLYAASERQIQKAIQSVGIKPDTTNAALVIIGENPEKIELALKEVKDCLQTEPVDLVLDLTPKKCLKIKEAFNITAQMLETVKIGGKSEDLALVDLVIEKIALLATEL